MEPHYEASCRITEYDGPTEDSLSGTLESSYLRRIKLQLGHGMPAVRSTFTVLLLLAISVVVAENCTSGLPPLIISGPPPHRSYNDAEPIKLVCRANGSQPISFIWYKDGRRIKEGDRSYPVTVDGTLKIMRSSPDTQGAYQCFASNPCGTAMSNITRLERMYIQPRTSPSQTRSQNNSVGNKVTIQCDQLQGTATVSYYWHKLDSDQCRGQGHKVKENARINMDDNGSLAFSNLVASDQGMYKCFVLGPNGRHGAGCVKLTVDPNPHQHNLVPQLMYHSRSPQIGFEGEDFHLTCFFSGRPTPNVTFSRRDGRALPRGRSHVDDVRHELTISNPSTEDSGYYVCQGQNEAGQSEPVRIAVNIYARPTLLERPVSRNTSQGLRAVFKCPGKGLPKPNVTWFKNTQPLNIDNMPKSMSISDDKTELSITSVRLEDRGTYHCNVSNEHGYVLAAAYLNVDENYVPNEIHVIDERIGDKKDTENGEGDGDKFTTSSVGYVIGAIVAAIILTVIVVLLVKRKKKSDSYNLGSPESYRLDTLGGDHAVGHRLLEEPQSPATQV